MSVRTLEQVQAEYSGLCARLGHLTYVVSRQREDIELLSSQIKALDKEALELNVAAEKAKAEEAKPDLAAVGA